MSVHLLPTPGGTPPSAAGADPPPAETDPLVRPESLARDLSRYAEQLRAEAARLHHRAGEIQTMLDALDRCIAALPVPDGTDPARRPALLGADTGAAASRAARSSARAEAPAGESGSAAALLPLQAFFFGEFRLFRGGERVVVSGGAKVSGLMKYLVFRAGAPVSQDALIETFWRRGRRDRALQSVHSAISAVRKILGRPEYLVCSAGAYHLSPEAALVTDVGEFREHLAVARRAQARGDLTRAVQAYESAVATYAGEFLAADAYDRWAEEERVSLSAAFAAALEVLAGLHAGAGDLERAADLHGRLLELDPLREASHRFMIEHHGRAGRRELAVRQYRALADTLRRELGVEPLRSTRSALRGAVEEGT